MSLLAPGLGMHAMAGNSTGVIGLDHTRTRVGSATPDAKLRSLSRRTQMQLDLSDDDVELLKEVLDTALDRLTSEIGHTDNPVYRQNLKGRRDRLRGLIKVFGGQRQA